MDISCVPLVSPDFHWEVVNWFTCGFCDELAHYLATTYNFTPCVMGEGLHVAVFADPSNKFVLDVEGLWRLEDITKRWEPFTEYGEVAEFIPFPSLPTVMYSTWVTDPFTNFVGDTLFEMASKYLLELKLENT